MGWVKRVEPERDLSNHTCPTPSLEDCKYGEVWRCTGEEVFPITRADARGERVRVPSLADRPPAQAKLLEALRALARPCTGRELVDEVNRRHGHGLRRETVSKAMRALIGDGLADCLNPGAKVGEEKLWTLPM